ncbi:hypothetical protein GGR54DRAFT_643799 [Hypoxylon sp. NC1633]|nr:hypothetical protein GGR54DRAFT_643799 [Hypoxylon sp. NC1633]
MASANPSGMGGKKSTRPKKQTKDDKKRSSKSPNKDQSSSQNKESTSGQGQTSNAGAYVSPPDFFSFNDPGDDFSAD